MALRAGTWLEPQLHPGSVLRPMTAALVGGRQRTFTGGVGAIDPGHGVCGADELLVTVNGTPNLTVNIAPGWFFLRGTENDPNQGCYYNVNDATFNLTGVPTGDATNPTWHLVVVRARNFGGGYSGANDDFKFDIVPGTPSASPSDPALTLYPNALVLARIVMPAGSNKVGGGAGQGTITDLRTFASPWANGRGLVPGGYVKKVTNHLGIGTSATDISGLTTGSLPYEKGRHLVITGQVRLRQRTSAGSPQLIIADGSNNQLNATYDLVATTDGYVTAHFEAEVEKTAAGNAEYKLRALTNSNTVDAEASATLPAFIRVVDIGGNAG